MELSIIILNYKMKRLVRNCLNAILQAKIPVSYEIIVVDNDSNDEIEEFLAPDFPEVKFVKSARNLGMGGGNNLGMKQATGKYFLVLNPDIFVFPNSIEKMYNYIKDRPQVGVLAPRLLNPDRSLQHTCYRWHKTLTPIYRRTFLGRLKFAQKDLDHFLMKDFDHQQNRKVDWCQGSCLLISNKALQKTGCFDDRFFMYFEDTDLCRRIWQNDYEVVYQADNQVIHMHMKMSGGGFLQVFTNRLTREHIKSWIKYAWKHRADKRGNIS